MRKRTDPMLPSRGRGRPPPIESEEPGGREPAPGALRLVQQFINSNDLEAGVDQLDTPAALGAWLRVHGLSSSRLRLTGVELERARSFRELLRSLALANNGVPLPPDTLRAVNRAFESLPVIGAFDQDQTHLEPASAGLDEALGRIAAIVISEALGGRWRRLKSCARDVCHWVFYDHSRSGTGTWCTMAICGSRTKANAYYRRSRGMK
jgi:predicted RNA-binding Zn ribbon-like protein